MQYCKLIVLVITLFLTQIFVFVINVLVQVLYVYMISFLINHCSCSQVSVFVLWCYGSKFLPTVFIIPLFYAVTLSCFCGEIVVSTNTTCTMVYPMPAVSIPLELWGGWIRHQYSLLTSQHAALVLLVLHFGKRIICEYTWHFRECA